MKKFKRIVLIALSALMLACSLSFVTGGIGNSDLVIQAYAEENSTTGSWKQNSTGKWWQRNDGTYPVNQWEKIDGKWYHFDGRGYMQTGWVKVNNIWYYLDKSTGWMLHDCWHYEGNDAYYLTSSGAMATGWKKIDNVWYYFEGNGKRHYGWLTYQSNKYYLRPTFGGMVTGMVEIDDGWYYFNSSGAMQKGTIQINGIEYKTDNTGKFRNGYYIDEFDRKEMKATCLAGYKADGSPKCSVPNVVIKGHEDTWRAAGWDVYEETVHFSLCNRYENGLVKETVFDNSCG